MDYQKIQKSVETLCQYCLELNGAECSACYVGTLLDAANEEYEKNCSDEKEGYRGKITLGETVDLTDPAYDANVWCRKTVNVLPGKYNCYATYTGDGHIAESWIIHEKYDIEERRPVTLTADTEVCTGLGIESGWFGYFDRKPDIGAAEWATFLDMEGSDDRFGWTSLDGHDGFITEAGYGYRTTEVCPVLWKDRSGKIFGIGTKF